MDSTWVGEAEFIGQAEVVGLYATHFECSEDQPDFCDIPCLYAPASGDLGLPRLANDERRAWLCFSNADAAVAAFGRPDPRRFDGESENGRDVHLVIGWYRYFFAFTDVVNEAEFVRALP